MKKKIFVGIVSTMLAAVSLVGIAACGGEEEKPEKEVHVHSYNENGVCECGAYDMPYITSLPMPEEYQKECDKQGTLVSHTYTTKAYALEALPENEGKDLGLVEKRYNVYLPYGYDETKPYNIYYLMHGTGGTDGYWLNDEPRCYGTTTRNVIDNMIAEGKCEPAIFVGITFYTIPEGYPGYNAETGQWDGFEDPASWPEYFWMELRNDLLPAVESTYLTYANKDVSEAGLQASRDHRAFSGLSQGSGVSIRSVVGRCTDMFSYIGSFSATYDVNETIDALTTRFPDYDIKFWYHGCGTAEPPAEEGHREFVKALTEQLPDRFVDGKNIALVAIPMAAHNYDNWIIAFYNTMLVFFTK